MRFDPTPRGDTLPTSAAIPFDVVPYLEVPEPDRPVLEPTDPGPVIFRDDEFEILNEPTELPTPSTRIAPEIPGWMPGVVLVVAGVFGLVPLAKAVRRRVRLRRLRNGDISAAWSEIVDRLADLGEDLGAAVTPLEFAGAVDGSLVPLATVYGSAAYGPEPFPDGATVALAEDSLGRAREGLTVRYTPGRRLLAAYRLRSLTPRWWRRHRNR